MPRIVRSSLPVSRITDQRLALLYQNPSIEPPYKIGRKQLKVSIAQFPQGFLKMFRLQHKALSVRFDHVVPYSFTEKFFQDWSPEILIWNIIQSYCTFCAWPTCMLSTIFWTMFWTEEMIQKVQSLREIFHNFVVSNCSNVKFPFNQYNYDFSSLWRRHHWLN